MTHNNTPAAQVKTRLGFHSVQVWDTGPIKDPTQQNETNYGFVRSVSLTQYDTKAKAVPLHATKTLRGRGGIAPTHSRPRH
jgi:hypothetical protein